MFSKKLVLAAMVGSSLIIAGCGGSGSSSTTTQKTKVSFSIADAPVDHAENVFLAIDAIELVKEGQDNFILDVSADGKDYVQVDLLELSGGKSALLLEDTELDPGSYQNLILHVLDESDGDGLSYVIEEANGGQVPMKQPSQKLRLGGFEVDSLGVQRFTIHIDLRSALVQNRNGQRYNLKPHGVTIVDNSTVSSLSGTVSPALINSCPDADPAGSFVYIYPGQITDAALLVDNYDSTVTATMPPAGSVQPVNSTQVTDTGTYAFGFIPEGDYTLAFSCSSANDDPEQYQGIDVTIPDPEGQIFGVTLDNAVDSVLDLDLLTP